MVDDESWNWTNVKQRLKKIENYHVEVPKGHEKWINPKLSGECSCHRLLQFEEEHH